MWQLSRLPVNSLSFHKYFSAINKKLYVNQKHRVDFEKAVLHVHAPAVHSSNKLLHWIGINFTWLCVVYNFHQNETGLFRRLGQGGSYKGDHNNYNVHKAQPWPILKKQKASDVFSGHNLEQHPVAGECHSCNGVNKNWRQLISEGRVQQVYAIAQVLESFGESFETELFIRNCNNIVKFVAERRSKIFFLFKNTSITFHNSPQIWIKKIEPRS